MHIGGGRKVLGEKTAIGGEMIDEKEFKEFTVYFYLFYSVNNRSRYFHYFD